MRPRASWLGVFALLLLTECQCRRQNPELIAVVKTGSPDKVKEALARGLSVNEKDECGATALHATALAGNKEIAQILIEKGAEVNAKTIYGRTPLHRTPSKDVAELLLSKGADVNIPDSVGAMTPLHWAASYGHREVAETLVKGKADLEGRNKYGSTPLHLAASGGQKAMAEFLIEKGVSVRAKDKDNQTPLHYAARSGHASLVHLLIAKGADQDGKDASGKTPEDLAYGDAAKDAFRFHHAAEAIRVGHVEEASAIIEQMTEVNAADGSGTTLLHLAAREGRGEVVELLVEKKANVNTMDSDERTSLDMAKDDPIREILRKHEGKTGKEIHEEQEKAEKKAGGKK